MAIFLFEGFKLITSINDTIGTISIESFVVLLLKFQRVKPWVPG